MSSPEMDPVGVARRRARRQRRLLAVALAGVLGWTGVSYLASEGQAQPDVSIVPGAAADGSVAAVRALTDTVTSSQGGSQKIAGVKFARVEMAKAYQTKVRVTFAWQNPSDFAKKTGSSSWQVRVGLYYPVRTGSCNGTDPDHAVTVTLTAAESWSGSQTTYCSYRDELAFGPGAVVAPGSSDRGTQLLANNFLLGSLRPQTASSNPPTCSAAGTTPCQPGRLDNTKRPLLVIASLLNPGGHVPPGQVDNLMSMDMYVRVTKVGE